jgi:hypothetical protein
VRPIDSNTLAALKGSRTGDQLIVWSWYNGQLAWPEPLKVASWTADWDDSRTGQNLSLTIEDPTNQLSPWLLSDPLGVGGARLQVIYKVGGAGTVNLDWHRVARSKPKQSWLTYTITDKGVVTPNSPVAPGQRLVQVPAGATVSVNGNDLSLMIANDKFIAPESPVGASPTVVGEIKRLLQDRVPVVVLSGVTDTSVNTTLVYQQQGDRWAAVQDLAKRIGAGVRMNGDAQCEVYPLSSSPVATLIGGPEGLQVSVDPEQDYAGTYNFFVADGTATVNGQSQPIRGTAQITGGELAFGGPHGRYPTFYSSTMLTTQAQADAYAIQMRDTQIAGLTTDLYVEALPQPHLQIGDWVTIPTPRTDGMAPLLTGRIVHMELKGTQTTVDRMNLTVRCNYADVRTALTSGTNYTIAGPITRS